MLLHHGHELATSANGLAPRARRDIEAAVHAGRFTARDTELAMVTVAGAAIGLGQLLHRQPERDDGAATDQVTEDLLRMLGLDAADAHGCSTRPLPALPTIGRVPDSAA